MRYEPIRILDLAYCELVVDFSCIENITSLKIISLIGNDGFRGFSSRNLLFQPLAINVKGCVNLQDFETLNPKNILRYWGDFIVTRFCIIRVILNQILPSKKLS